MNKKTKAKIKQELIELMASGFIGVIISLFYYNWIVG